MALKANSFEGGTDGAAITASGSGGASGDAFSLVQTGTGSTLVWSNAQAMHGGMSALITASVTTTSQGLAQLVYTQPASVTQYAARFYIRFDGTMPTSVQPLFVFFLSGSGSAYTYMNPGGRVRLDDISATKYNSPAGTPLVADTWYRFEYVWTCGATTTTGGVQFAVYDGDSTTALFSYTSATANVGTNQTVANVQFGRPATLSNPNAVVRFYVDDVAVDEGGSAFIGPAVNLPANVSLAGAGALTATATPLVARSVSLTGSGALSGTGQPLTTSSVSVAGSGALTATAIHVATATLSASGVLDADFGALTVNANLTGAGTLSATRARISVGADLTGVGALSVSVTIPIYRLALDGSGTLAAAVTPSLTIAADLDGVSGLAMTSSYKLFAWVFRTPAQEIWFRMAGRGLVGTYAQGLTVYRVGGQWRSRLSPGPDELAAADRSFQGGYLHQLSDDERADLIAGGFSDSITYEEVPA